MDRSVNERFVAYLESNKIDEPKIYLKLHILKGKWNNYKSGTRPISTKFSYFTANRFPAYAVR